MSSESRQSHNLTHIGLGCGVDHTLAYYRLKLLHQFGIFLASLGNFFLKLQMCDRGDW